jgi:penicillin-binding protein 2
MAQKETFQHYLQETQLFQRRLWVATVAIVILLALLVLRLFYLQIVQHTTYTTLSAENQFNMIPVVPNRGLIYDRNGVLLAQNIPVLSLAIIPERIKDLQATIAQLQTFINITPDDIQRFQKALRQHRPFEPIPLKMRLTDQEAARFYIDQFRFPGVSIEANLMRYYPLGEQMTSVIGYVSRINEQDLLSIDNANYAGTNYIGKLGIEKYFEQELHGTVGYQQVEMNANGRVVRVMKRIPTIPGENLYLTIDSNLQVAAEKALGDATGAVVAIQPSTGQVLALVSNPSYDPNLFVNGISAADYKNLQTAPGKPLYNRAVRGQFPIASTIKPYMALQGLDTGTITPSYTINDPGWFKLPDASHIYHDWELQGHGVVNVVKAITVSCDTFMFGLGWKMGIDKIDDILSRFGFGKRTGIEMEEELSGLVPSPVWKLKTLGIPWYAGDTVVASIGQGYNVVTPIQLAQGVAALAERGARYKPTLVLKWQKSDGTFVDQAPIKKTPVELHNPETWNLIIQGMQGVIEEPSGTAYSYWKGTVYPAAGKTGTAQLFKRPPGKINPASLPPNLRNHSLFIVFAPVNNPQIAIAVVVEHALVPASSIGKKVMDYYMLTEHHWDPELTAPQQVSTATQSQQAARK